MKKSSEPPIDVYSCSEVSDLTQKVVPDHGFRLKTLYKMLDLLLETSVRV